MTFELEVVKARKGDCLLLRYGKSSAPALALIDGGPPGVYPEFLEPRLTELRSELATNDEPLPLELVMVSHIDSDHIAGVLSLLRTIEHARDGQSAEPYEVGRLWHNGFKRLADASDESVDAVRAALTDEEKGGAVIASVGQGEDTSAVATKLGVPRNEEGELGQLVLAGQSRKLPGGLELTVLGPTRKRVEDLREKWAKEVHAKEAELVPAAVKETIYNLSSLIVVAEFEGRRILLTGDGVSEDILAGLEKQDLLDGKGHAHFDVLKMPHHGSDHNVTPEFLERVKADHYAISGNGQDGNPEPETLRMIAAARKDDPYHVWLTYREGEQDLTQNVAAFLKEQREAGSKATVHFPEDGALSMSIDLS